MVDFFKRFLGRFFRLACLPLLNCGYVQLKQFGQLFLSKPKLLAVGFKPSVKGGVGLNWERLVAQKLGNRRHATQLGVRSPGLPVQNCEGVDPYLSGQLLLSQPSVQAGFLDMISDGSQRLRVKREGRSFGF